MDAKRYKTLKLLSSLGLAGLLLLSIGLSLGLAQGPFTKTRVTVSSDGANRDSFFPSLSADGAKVAFFSDSDFLGQGIADDQYEIWLYDITTLSLTRVTTSSDGANRESRYPSLNAFGTKIAFHSNSDFLNQGITQLQLEIWLYDITSKTLTRVTTSSDATTRYSCCPSLSADGTKVAFTSDSDFLGQGIPDNQFEIWLYDTATMTVTRVTTASASNRSSGFPYLSADGTTVAFDSDSDFLGQGLPNNQWEIWLYDITTLSLTRVTTSTATAIRFDPYFDLSADGTKVAFDSNSDFLGQGIPDDQFEIWLYDDTTMSLTRITTASNAANRDSRAPSLNEDGTKIAFDSDSDFLGQGLPDGQVEIWLYDTTTMTFTRVTTSGANRGSVAPSLNEDGSKVAFQSTADFLGQGIAQHQWEVWLFEDQSVIVDPPDSTVYLPIILKN